MEINIFLKNSLGDNAILKYCLAQFTPNKYLTRKINQMFSYRPPKHNYISIYSTYLSDIIVDAITKSYFYIKYDDQIKDGMSQDDFYRLRCNCEDIVRNSIEDIIVIF